MEGNYLWLLSADAALEFYDRCERKEAITEKERAAVMIQMYREGLIQCLGHTLMSKAEAIEQLAKVANIIQVRKKNAND